MVKKFEKSPCNNSFNSLQQLQLYRDSYVNDNPNDVIPQEVPKRDLLEAIIKNQEHLYERQQAISKTVNEAKQERSSYYKALYRGIFKNNGFVLRAATFILAAATLIPMCSRQKKLYEQFKENEDFSIKEYMQPYMYPPVERTSLSLADTIAHPYSVRN
ncbi:hypothetical protein K9M74_03090 [Candidatus Woesearchaeota archaeon]|nr:hypothetical protein [Candidatus Woesearchaeota archaeon]